MLHSFSMGILFHVNKLNTWEERVEIDYDRSSSVIVLTLYSARIEL